MRVKTMNKNKQKIIAKIKALFELAESTSFQEEKLSAESKALDLMKKYGVTRKEVGLPPLTNDITDSIFNFDPNKFAQDFELFSVAINAMNINITNAVAETERQKF